MGVNQSADADIARRMLGREGGPALVLAERQRVELELGSSHEKVGLDSMIV